MPARSATTLGGAARMILFYKHFYPGGQEERGREGGWQEGNREGATGQAAHYRAGKAVFDRQGAR